MKHAECIGLVTQWLRGDRSARLVLTELSELGSVEIPDVIAWVKRTSLLVEVKVSRADFMRDRKKPFRLHPSTGMGHHRMYAAPPGLIRAEDLPAGWGLLEVSERGRVMVVVHPKPFGEWNKDAETALLLAYAERASRTLPSGAPLAPHPKERALARAAKRVARSTEARASEFNKRFPKIPVRARP